MRCAVPLLILLAGSPAVAADQFDLACTGDKWTVQGGKSEPYVFRTRIDLAAQKWCEGDCKTVQSLYSATDDKLVLTDEGTLNSRMEMSRVVTFDRKAGNFHYLFVQTRPTDGYLEYWARCTTEAFTGFPG